MKIATWNINSVRLREEILLNFIKKNNIEVICLQETKTENNLFPLNYFKNEGYIYHHLRGEKSFNGVAILSKIPILFKSHIDWCNLKDARHIYVKLNNNIVLHNFYLPAGGDVPDLKKKKFKHKINFLKQMINYFEKDNVKNKILLGDLNIAPSKNDVWSHKQLTNVVSHTEIEIKYMNQLLQKGKLIDIVRKKNKENDKLFSWWSYRNKDWKKSNRGRRLDHILISQNLLNFIEKIKIYKEMRAVEKPSDHVPITIELKTFK